MHPIQRPPGSTTASPQLGSSCVGDFLEANSTRTKRPAEEVGLRPPSNAAFSGWRSRMLSSNLDSGETRSSAYRCSQTRPPTAQRQHGYVAWDADNSVFAVIRTPRHRPHLSQVCWSDAYDHVMGLSWTIGSLAWMVQRCFQRASGRFSSQHLSTLPTCFRLCFCVFDRRTHTDTLLYLLSRKIVNNPIEGLVHDLVTLQKRR
jgi:hypothetical protein